MNLWIELSLPQNQLVIFSVDGVYSEEWVKNQIGYAIKRIMEITEVSDMNNIIGKPVVAIFSEKTIEKGSYIIGIQHFLNENLQFIPTKEKLWKEMYKDL